MAFNIDEFNLAGTSNTDDNQVDISTWFGPEDNWGGFESRERPEGKESGVLDTHLFGVDPEESGVTHSAPYDIQATMSYTPADSYQYTLKRMLKQQYPEAIESGHYFDVYQDKDSGKWVYTDPDGNKTWVEPPGVDVEDFTSEIMPTAYETTAGATLGAAGFASPVPGGTYAGVATGAGIGGFTWRAQDLSDRLDKGLLDPAIYGTAEYPNYLALFNESAQHGTYSVVGTLGGDVLNKAFGWVFNKAKDKLIEKKITQIVDDAIVEGVKKKDELLIFITPKILKDTLKLN